MVDQLSILVTFTLQIGHFLSVPVNSGLIHARWNLCPHGNNVATSSVIGSKHNGQSVSVGIVVFILVSSLLIFFPRNLY